MYENNDILKIMKIVLLLLLIILYVSCEMDPVDNPNMQKKTRYYYHLFKNEKLFIYMVDTVLYVKFKENATYEQMQALNNKYNIISKYDDFKNRRECRYNIDRSKINNYLTKYGENIECFGNDTIIEFTSLGYEYNPGEYYKEGIYISNIFCLMFDNNLGYDKNKLNEINKINNVEYIEKDTNYYDNKILIYLKVNKNSPFDALDMANLYHEKYFYSTRPEFYDFEMIPDYYNNYNN
jgi:hypothetical protein